MAKQEPKQSGFDGSWAAWKDRLGIAGVLIVVALLFLFMFTDASLNFQCSVTDFIMMKCNRFKREFKPWKDEDKKQQKSSSAPSIEYRGGKVAAIQSRPTPAHDLMSVARKARCKVGSIGGSSFASMAAIGPTRKSSYRAHLVGYWIYFRHGRYQVKLGFHRPSHP